MRIRLSREDPDSGDSIGGVPEMQGVLGSAISDVSCLASARASSQRGLTKLCSRALERECRKVASVTDCIRLTECRGHEAQWVTRCPTRPEFCMKSHLWRVAILVRLALPLPHLRLPQKGCECHVRFDAAESTRRRRRRRPKPVDKFGEHDQRFGPARLCYFLRVIMPFFMPRLC